MLNNKFELAKVLPNFFFRLSDFKARKRASVPLLQPIEYFVLQNFEKFCSKTFTLFFH